MIKSLCFIISASMVAGVWAAEPMIRVMPVPELSGQGPVYLRDIAEFDNVPEDWVSKLGWVQVAQSSQSLHDLSAKQFMISVRQAVASFEAECECHVRLNIPRKWLVYTNDQKFNLQNAKKEIESILQRDCEECEYQLSDLRVVRGRVPNNYRNWKLASGVERLRGPKTISIYFDGNLATPLVLGVNVRIFKPALKTKKRYLRGKTVNLSEVGTVRKEITHERRTLATAQDLEGGELRRSLVEGRIIYLDNLVARQSTRYGQPIKIEIVNDTVSLQVDGIAKKNGRVGDVIPVVINKTRKKMMAEIIGDARVRVQ